MPAPPRGVREGVVRALFGGQVLRERQEICFAQLRLPLHHGIAAHAQPYRGAINARPPHQRANVLGDFTLPCTPLLRRPTAACKLLFT